MMSFLRTRVLGRFTILGRIADLLLVLGLVVRLAQRRGWVSDARMSQLGLGEVSKGEPLGIAEVALAGAAALRLLRRGKPAA